MSQTAEFKISPTDLEMLKIASIVSKSIFLKAGSKDLLAKNSTLQCDEGTVFMASSLSFAPTRDLAIGDLTKLISMLETYKEPVLSMEEADNFLSISGDRVNSRFKLMLTGKAQIQNFVCRANDIPLSKVLVQATITAEDLNVIRHACGISKLTFIKLAFDGQNKLTAIALPGLAKNAADNKRFAEADQFQMELQLNKAETTTPFDVVIKVDDMRAIPNDTYKIEISKDEFTVSFKGDDGKPKFWLGTQD